MPRPESGRVLIASFAIAGAAFGTLFHSNPSPAQGTPAVAPSGTIIYTAAAACPSGWTEPSSLQGRFVVGTGVAGNVAAIAGDALAADAAPAHTHGVSIPVHLDSKDLSMGGLGPKSNTAGTSGDFTVIGQTASSHGNLPILQLRACRRP